MLKEDGLVLQMLLGSTDAPLSEAGREVLRDKKNIIEKYKPVQKLYCSPMKRCLETADLLFIN